MLHVARAIERSAAPEPGRSEKPWYLEEVVIESEDHGCQELLSGYLADRALIIAANRGPVTFEQNEDGTLQFERGGGGLVTASPGSATRLRAQPGSRAPAPRPTPSGGTAPYPSMIPRSRSSSCRPSPPPTTGTIT
ncbi:MAG: hypothetical protein EHM56_06430 [Chloroflexi bacterium]|nr:MAG: hypothetical protein EHM56_06430 [Chloroflexota bacterium]